MGVGGLELELVPSDVIVCCGAQGGDAEAEQSFFARSVKRIALVAGGGCAGVARAFISDQWRGLTAVRLTAASPLAERNR